MEEDLIPHYCWFVEKTSKVEGLRPAVSAERMKGRRGQHGSKREMEGEDQTTDIAARRNDVGEERGSRERHKSIRTYTHAMKRKLCRRKDLKN